MRRGGSCSPSPIWPRKKTNPWARAAEVGEAGVGEASPRGAPRRARRAPGPRGRPTPAPRAPAAGAPRRRAQREPERTRDPEPCRNIGGRAANQAEGRAGAWSGARAYFRASEPPSRCPTPTSSSAPPATSRIDVRPGHTLIVGRAVTSDVPDLRPHHLAPARPARRPGRRGAGQGPRLLQRHLHQRRPHHRGRGRAERRGHVRQGRVLRPAGRRRPPPRPSRKTADFPAPEAGGRHDRAPAPGARVRRPGQPAQGPGEGEGRAPGATAPDAAATPPPPATPRSSSCSSRSRRRCPGSRTWTSCSSRSWTSPSR